MDKNYTDNTYGTLVIELTYDCDLRCPWCVEAAHVGKKAGALSPVALSRILERTLVRPYKNYVFQGGEPLIHALYMLAIVDAITEKQPDSHFRLFTNGTHLTSHLVGELNRRDIQVIVSLEATGYKGVTNFILHHAKDPENALENIRQLHDKWLRIVATREKIAKETLAGEILLLHNYIPDCIIEVALDLTQLEAYTLEDIQKLGEQYTALKNRIPGSVSWFIPLQGHTRHCDAFTEWYILETDNIKEKCPLADRPASGCGVLRGRMKPEVYEAYTKITGNTIGVM